MSEEDARREVRRAVDAQGGRVAFARKAKIDPGTLGEFLNGNQWPHARTRTKIEHALGWDAGRIEDLREEVAIARRLNGVPELPDVDVPGAILSDPKLLPEARAHLLNQYELLLRLHPAPPDLVVEQERRRQEAEVQATGKAMLKAIPKEPPAKTAAKAAKKAGTRRRRST